MLTSGQGLSPRVRGNRSQAPHHHGRGRSIPASAGEPRIVHKRSPNRTVYPRECGGTPLSHLYNIVFSGLSPRVRGNQRSSRYAHVWSRSIPASAGEPRMPVTVQSAGRVYPRECGGTPVHTHTAYGDTGLSPRVRGNRFSNLRPRTWWRSIPASAGEPSVVLRILRDMQVYPRECGGTYFRQP